MSDLRCAAPALAVPRVFHDDAQRGELVPEPVGAREVTRRAGRDACVEQALDGRRELVGRVGQDCQHGVQLAQRGEDTGGICRRQRADLDPAIDLAHELEQGGQALGHIQVVVERRPERLDGRSQDIGEGVVVRPVLGIALESGDQRVEACGGIALPAGAELIHAREIVANGFRALGGDRTVWVLLWAALPLVSPLIFSTVARATGRSFGTAEFLDAFPTQGGLAWASLVLLWGCGRLGEDAERTRDELVRSAPRQIPDRLFAAVARRDGPILLTVVVTGIIVANNWASFGLLPPLASLPLFLAYMFPIMTFIWVFVAILTDINMPGLTGLELISFVRCHPSYRQIPIIIISTEKTEADRQRGLALGASDYITKPFAPNDLQRVIKQHLGM